MKSVVHAPQSIVELRFFDPRAEIVQGANRLPHWEQAGGTYFVTFRLADSIPQEQLAAWKHEREVWLRANPPPFSKEQECDYHEQFTAPIETWLDRGHGSCALRRPEVCAIVENALHHFEATRTWMLQFVIMPNHVHALFAIVPPHSLPDILQSWKGFSAREANRLLGLTGVFWMRDYFDRLIRDAGHFWRCARYLRTNPEKARLGAGEFALFEAPWIRAQLDAERSGGFPAAGLELHSDEVIRTRRLESRRSPSSSPPSSP